MAAVEHSELSKRWINRYRKIRAATFFVSRIYSRVQTIVEMRAHCCHQVPACRKSDHSNLVRINMPFGGVKTQQPHCPLRVFQRRQYFRYDAASHIWSS